MLAEPQPPVRVRSNNLHFRQVPSDADAAGQGTKPGATAIRNIYRTMSDVFKTLSIFLNPLNLGEAILTKMELSGAPRVSRERAKGNSERGPPRGSCMALSPPEPLSTPNKGEEALSQSYLVLGSTDVGWLWPCSMRTCAMSQRFSSFALSCKLRIRKDHPDAHVRPRLQRVGPGRPGALLGNRVPALPSGSDVGAFRAHPEEDLKMLQPEATSLPTGTLLSPS